MSASDDAAIAMFDIAKSDDIVTHREAKDLLKDLKLEDWQAVSKKYTEEGNLYGVKGGLYVEEKPDEFVIHNNEMDLRAKSIFNGLKSLGIGTVMTGVGWGGYTLAGKHLLSFGSPYAKLVGLGIGVLSAYVHNKLTAPEIEETKAIPEIKIPKMSLSSRIEANSVSAAPNKMNFSRTALA